jgi:CubicO group peptidase (beta-lactamase class C family)
MTLMRFARLSLAFSLIVVAGPARAQETNDAALVARIDSLAKDYMTLKKAPAVSIAVVRGKDTIVMKGYGLASREANRAATASTIYRIGSITKQFTAAGIMREVEQGKIMLDDPITKYLPDVPTHGQTITVRNLLSHTSGVHNYTDKPEWTKRWGQEMTPRQIVAFVDKDTLDFPPGTKYSYSNTGYVLLGMILEKVTGQPYATYLQRQFFTPFGLTQTSYCPDRTKDPQFADGYSATTGTVKPAEYLNITQPFSAGALCSTVRDLVKWQRAFLDGRVVGARSYSLMTTADTLTNGSKINYGFGLVPGQLGGQRTIGHSGGINGFTTYALYVPDENLNVAVLSNSDGGPGPLALNVTRAVLGIPLVPMPRPLVAVALADSLRDRIPGVYDFGQLVLNITLEDGRLMMAPDGQTSKVPLVHLGNLRFGTDVDRSLSITFVNERGKISKAQFAQRGNSLDGIRKP